MNTNTCAVCTSTTHSTEWRDTATRNQLAMHLDSTIHRIRERALFAQMDGTSHTSAAEVGILGAIADKTWRAYADRVAQLELQLESLRTQAIKSLVTGEPLSAASVYELLTGAE